MMDWWFNLFGPLSWLFMYLAIGIYIAISVLIAFYVHKDAVRRGIVNSEVWLIIGLIFNILGLLIYLIFRGNYMEKSINPVSKSTNIDTK
jgi:Na+-driven multidrug efflux pump